MGVLKKLSGLNSIQIVIKRVNGYPYRKFKLLLLSKNKKES